MEEMRGLISAPMEFNHTNSFLFKINNAQGEKYKYNCITILAQILLFFRFFFFFESVSVLVDFRFPFSSRSFRGLDYILALSRSIGRYQAPVSEPIRSRQPPAGCTKGRSLCLPDDCLLGAV